MTPTSVKMPGGDVCKGGVCKKVSSILRAKPSTKKRYAVKKVVKKPVPPVIEEEDDVVKTEPKMLLSITDHSAGEVDKKIYDGEDTPGARKKSPGAKKVK